MVTCMHPTPSPSVSSLVLTLTTDLDQRRECLRGLARQPDLELGEVQEHWIPVVLESAEPAARVRELESLPGITFVEVVFVEVPEDEPAILT